MRRNWRLLQSGIRAAVLTVTLSMLVTAVPAGASQEIVASPSSFCSTLMAFHPHAPTNSRDWTAYRAFAKTVIPTFEKLAATAPNRGTKELMNQLVAQLKFDATATNASEFTTYWRTHIRHWEYDWQQFAGSVLTCVKALY